MLEILKNKQTNKKPGIHLDKECMRTHEKQNNYFRVIELWIIFSSKFSLMLYCFCNTNTMHMKRISMNKAIRDCLKEKQEH